MINERTIKKLKQTNISEDTDKTKVRVHQLWKASTKAQKQAVEEAAGISRATIYRVYKTGSVSAKLVAPMAYNFNVDPNYLIGKSDTAGECTDEILNEFLKDLGYGKLLASEPIKAKKRKEKTFNTTTDTTTGTTKKAEKQESAELSFAAAPSIKPEELTLADLHLLMQSLLLREKAGVEDAVNKAARLRALLLS